MEHRRYLTSLFGSFVLVLLLILGALFFEAQYFPRGIADTFFEDFSESSSLLTPSTVTENTSAVVSDATPIAYAVEREDNETFAFDEPENWVDISEDLPEPFDIVTDLFTLPDDDSDSATAFDVVVPDELLGEMAVVAAVTDGDTIRLTDGRIVRYIGIDTPEITKGKNECFGQEAAARNRALVLGRTIRLTKDVSETDRYGRLLRFVWVGEQMINAQLVAEGYANTATFPPDVSQAEVFHALENEARLMAIGLWGGCRSMTRDQSSSVPQATQTACPESAPIKANAQSMIYHLPGQKYYEETRPEECFATEREVELAGYRKARI